MLLILLQVRTANVKIKILKIEKSMEKYEKVGKVQKVQKDLYFFTMAKCLKIKRSPVC